MIPCNYEFDEFFVVSFTLFTEYRGSAHRREPFQNGLLCENTHPGPAFQPVPDGCFLFPFACGASNSVFLRYASIRPPYADASPAHPTKPQILLWSTFRRVWMDRCPLLPTLRSRLVSPLRFFRSVTSNYSIKSSFFG